MTAFFPRVFLTLARAVESVITTAAFHEIILQVDVMALEQHCKNTIRT